MHQIGARKRSTPGNTILSQAYRQRVSTDRPNRERSQLAASLECESGPTPAGKTLPHSYPETRFMVTHIYSKSMDHPSKVANPARGQLNRGKHISLSAFAPENWSRETGSAVPSRVSLLISILRLNLVLTYGIPPGFHGSVHLLFIYLKPP